MTTRPGCYRELARTVYARRYVGRPAQLGAASLNAGCWIVTDERGRARVVSDRDFRAGFRPDLTPRELMGSM